MKPSWEGRTHTVEEIDKIVTGMTHFRIGKNLKGELLSAKQCDLCKKETTEHFSMFPKNIHF